MTNIAISGVLLIGLSARLSEQSTKRSVRASWVRDLDMAVHAASRGIAGIAAAVGGITGMVLLIYAFIGKQVDELTNDELTRIERNSETDVDAAVTDAAGQVG